MLFTKEMFLRHAPYWMQDIAIGWYNSRLYKVRRGRMYLKWQNYYAKWDEANHIDWQDENKRRLNEFLAHACLNSPWYRKFSGGKLSDFPVLEKESLINNLSEIATIDERSGIVSLTGGTSGASMKVIYTREDMEERHALLDYFRGSYGYRLGEKVAWFSGKNLASEADVIRGRCYRDDRRNQIRFFSTFRISRKNFDSYWNALEDFRPKYIVGFPSSVLEIAMYARERGLKADWSLVVMFPTAETVLPIHREVIGDVFGCKLVDQYASSEGAPFILECEAGRLHLHPLTGIFEVLDEQGYPAQEGEIVVTSFNTRGTPLIRYRIGDRIRLASSEARCKCGSNFPLVDWIDGRSGDFVYSAEMGRVNLGNLSNSTKDVSGILCFQVQQDAADEIQVKVVGDSHYDKKEAEKFERALRARVGMRMKIRFEQVEGIKRERSGKFRIVKNNISFNNGS